MMQVLERRSLLKRLALAGGKRMALTAHGSHGSLARRALEFSRNRWIRVKVPIHQGYSASRALPIPALFDMLSTCDELEGMPCPLWKLRLAARGLGLAQRELH